MHRRLVGRAFRLPGEHDDVAAAAVAVQVQRHSRVRGEVVEPPRLAVTVDERGTGRVVPEEPHGRGLRRAGTVHVRQPGDRLVPEPAGYPHAELAVRVGELQRCHGSRIVPLSRTKR